MEFPWSCHLARAWTQGFIYSKAFDLTSELSPDTPPPPHTHLPCSPFIGWLSILFQIGRDIITSLYHLWSFPHVGPEFKSGVLCIVRCVLYQWTVSGPINDLFLVLTFFSAELSMADNSITRTCFSVNVCIKAMVKKRIFCYQVRKTELEPWNSISGVFIQCLLQTCRFTRLPHLLIGGPLDSKLPIRELILG